MNKLPPSENVFHWGELYRWEVYKANCENLGRIFDLQLPIRVVFAIIMICGNMRQVLHVIEVSFFKNM